MSEADMITLVCSLGAFIIGFLIGACAVTDECEKEKMRLHTIIQEMARGYNNDK